MTQERDLDSRLIAADPGRREALPVALWLPSPAGRPGRGARHGAPRPPRGVKVRAGERPFVLVETHQGALRIAALDAVAARQGLAVGMGLAQARAIWPRIDVVEADPAADAALLRRAAGALLRHVHGRSSPCAGATGSCSTSRAAPTCSAARTG